MYFLFVLGSIPFLYTHSPPGLDLNHIWEYNIKAGVKKQGIKMGIRVI